MNKENEKLIYGLIGYPVKHSLSPQMHNAAFSALKINAQYLLFEVKPQELEGFLLKKVFSEGIRGLNITIPHKVKAREILEKNFPFDKNVYMQQEGLYYVKLSGAVNTLKNCGAKLEYWNTDAAGFLRSLELDLKFPAQGKKVLLIGCGGAGRAVVAALSWKNIGIAKIYLNDIDERALESAKEHFSQFSHLKDNLEFIGQEKIAQVIADCSLLVNATPLGMEGREESVISKDLLHRGLYVYDIVYNKEKPTRLIRDAEAFGLPRAGGLNLLLRQGTAAFELWRGESAPVEAMEEALKKGAGKL